MYRCICVCVCLFVYSLAVLNHFHVVFDMIVIFLFPFFLSLVFPFFPCVLFLMIPMMLLFYYDSHVVSTNVSCRDSEHVMMDNGRKQEFIINSVYIPCYESQHSSV